MFQKGLVSLVSSTVKLLTQGQNKGPDFQGTTLLWPNKLY